MSDNNNNDPNAQAETLAKLLQKITDEAKDAAAETRSPNPHGDIKDPNVLAQALESRGDPSTMPKSLQEVKKDEDGKDQNDAPQENPNDTAEKLQLELNKAIGKVDGTYEEEKTENEPEKNEESFKSEATSAPAEPEYSPPEAAGESDSAPQKPDAPSEWHGEEKGPDVEASWPSAVYDPTNPEGSETVEGGSSSQDASADWGNNADNYESQKPAEEAPQESKDTPAEESNEETSEEQQEETWDHDDDPSTPEIVIKGAKFGVNSPKKEDVRTQDVIVAHSIDHKRDEKVGVALSTYNLNYVFAEPDERDHKFSAMYGAPDANYLPAMVDLRSKWGSVLDQLDLGSCVSNSVSYAIRFCFKKQNLGDFTPSRLFIYYNGRMLAGYPINEDTGLTIRDGYKAVTKYSVCSENNWPYLPNKFSQRPPDTCYVAAQTHKTFRYINLDNSEVQIKKCLKDGYPVSFGAALFQSFMGTKVAKSGVVPMPVKNEARCGGHAMTIAGYDDAKKAFLVANNWGSTWGEKGFCWMPYAYITNDDWVGDLWSPRYFGA